jgi:hypothetical protein
VDLVLRRISAEIVPVIRLNEDCSRVLAKVIIRARLGIGFPEAEELIDRSIDRVA